jgi:CO/xanthine dehydrogenase Mo-binding subunit
VEASPLAQPCARIRPRIAYVRYNQALNYIAIAMEVSVDRASGKIAIRRAACAHDCGLVANPDAVRNQVEGRIMQTLGRTLHEEVKFDSGRWRRGDRAGRRCAG